MPLGALLPSRRVLVQEDAPYRVLVALPLFGGPATFLLAMGWALKLQVDTSRYSRSVSIPNNRQRSVLKHIQLPSFEERSQKC